MARRKQKADDEVDKRAVLHRWVALVLGYNELAKQAPVLGEKLYFRFCCDEAEKGLRLAGGDIEIKRDATILQLGDAKVFINLYEKDIELMRAAVKKYDKEQKRK